MIPLAPMRLGGRGEGWLDASDHGHEFERAAARELDKLEREAARRIVRFLRDRVAPLDDPRSLGQPLKRPELGQFWNRALRILVVRIGHRREVHGR